VRWNSWLPLAGSVTTAAAGAGLTWESNPLGGERSGLIVMFGDRAPALPALILLGALLVALAGVVAAMVHHRTMYILAAIVGALSTLGSLSWYGVRISGERVRAIGTDSAGNLVEPEAAGRLGIGWYLTTAALVATAVLAIGLTRRTRARS
jgi:hypothetical protein